MELVTGPALGTIVDREATGGEAGRKAPGNPLALAAVANGGLAVHPRPVSSVTDPATGRTTGVAPAPAERALSAGTSREPRPAGGFLDTPHGPLGYAVVVEAGAAARGDGRARDLARAISTAIGETR